MITNLFPFCADKKISPKQNFSFLSLFAPSLFFLPQTKKKKMVSLRLQKRLAASVLNCGKRKVWLDPNETTEISNANSRNSIFNFSFIFTPHLPF